MTAAYFLVETHDKVATLRLVSDDGTNCLTRSCVSALIATLQQLARETRPLVVAGNSRFFSVGADLNEIAALNGPEAYAFSRLGQKLMSAIEQFPAPVYAAVEGHCMGGGLDLALACHRRIASPEAVFGHRGAALGLMTGWGGTQRLPRLIGKAKALELFLTAEKLTAAQALQIGLVDAIAEDPIEDSVRRSTALSEQFDLGVC